VQGDVKKRKVAIGQSNLATESKLPKVKVEYIQMTDVSTPPIEVTSPHQSPK